ncbi:YicS family protein [Lelliottia nimipressuralis]
MKAAHLFCLVICLLFAAFVHANETQDPVKTEKIRQAVMKDIKKVCSPQGKQTDKEWQAMIMSSEANKLLVKNAVLAMERDNLDNYWEAVDKVDCMEDY